MSNDLNGEDALGRINQLIVLGRQILDESKLTNYKNNFQEEIENWRSEVIKVLRRYFPDGSIINKFEMETVFSNNKFSRQETINNFSESLEKGCRFLEGSKENIKEDSFNHKNIINTVVSKEIIRRILNNFYKHIQSMYNEKPHGRGTIKQEDLNKIQIGNEYDVQRILYSLIRPIFPEARLEVSEDTGYGFVRYDIFLEEYSITIEVKCTRSNMTERQLTEELGSDAFHYKAEHLFLFIFDKGSIIKNIDTFIKTYTREKCTFGKDIEAIIIQPIKL